jgi:hypothetical protein
MSWLEWLIEGVGAIPAVFWGVIVGSVFSLSGVYFTNRASERRMKAQFIHERDLRKADREIELRKDVYLSVAEAASAGFHMISRLSNLQVTLDTTSAGYLAKAPAIAKLNIIANEITLGAVVKATTEMATAILRISTKRIPLEAKLLQLTAMDAQILASASERARWIEEMKQQNLDVSKDKRRWDIIKSNFDFEQKQNSDMSGEREIFARNFSIQQLDFAEECFAETCGLIEVFVRALAAMRAELGVPTDDVLYSQIFINAKKHQQESLSGFFAFARDAVYPASGAKEPSSSTASP